MIENEIVELVKGHLATAVSINRVELALPKYQVVPHLGPLIEADRARFCRIEHVDQREEKWEGEGFTALVDQNSLQLFDIYAATLFRVRFLEHASCYGVHCRWWRWCSPSVTHDYLLLTDKQVTRVCIYTHLEASHI